MEAPRDGRGVAHDDHAEEVEEHEAVRDFRVIFDPFEPLHDVDERRGLAPRRFQGNAPVLGRVVRVAVLQKGDVDAPDARVRQRPQELGVVRARRAPVWKPFSRTSRRWRGNGPKGPRDAPRARALPRKSSSASTEPRATVVPAERQRHVLARASKNELPSAGAHRFQVHDEPHVLRIGVLRREGVRRELVRLLRAVDEDDDIPRGAVRRKIPQRLEQDTDGQEVVRGAGRAAGESMCALSRTAPFSSARPFRRATTHATSSYTPTKPPRNCAGRPRALGLIDTPRLPRPARAAPPSARTRAPRPARARRRCAARATRGPSRASPPSASNPAGAGTRRRQLSISAAHAHATARGTRRQLRVGGFSGAAPPASSLVFFLRRPRRMRVQLLLCVLLPAECCSRAYACLPCVRLPAVCCSRA